LIDFGLDEIFVHEGEIVLYADFHNFGSIQKYLEDNKFDIRTFAFERIPNDTKELNEEQQADVEKLLEKMEEDDDVINVFHNMR